MNINSTRKEYSKSRGFTKRDNDPFKIFKNWYKLAQKEVSEPNAFALSTSYKNKPISRMMLLKEFDEKFLFFTNKSSKKGRDIKANKFASILFWWKEIGKQVRIEGSLVELKIDDVKKYFYTRPFESQIGALTSNQSSEIGSYSQLKKKFFSNKKRFKDAKVPFPVNWTGYELNPSLFEFWQGGPYRLHDRLEFKKTKNIWKSRILAP